MNTIRWRDACASALICYENNVVFLYSARQNLVYGKVYQDGKSTLIGEPPPEVAKDLERLWQELFRSSPQSSMTPSYPRIA